MPNQNRINVLLVEDSRCDAVLVQRMLCSASPGTAYDFITVPRMRDALEVLDRQSFDIALLDLNLLDVDGVAAVSALHTAMPGTPIIVYSGADDIVLRQQASLCGAKYYLVKGRESPYALKFMIEQSLAA